MANEYLSLTELKATSELYGFSFADEDARQAISAASRGIDEYCGRRFYSDADASSIRYYTPVEPQYLEIDDLVTCGTVATDSDGDGVFETTWTVNTNYILEPLNAAADGKPYERLRVAPYGGYFWPYRGRRSVAVTGMFGWSSVPPTVKEATTIMATRLLKRAREAPFGVVGLGLDNVAVRISQVDPDVAFLLDPFVRGQGILIS